MKKQRNNIKKGAHIRLIKKKESPGEEIPIDNSKNYQKNIRHGAIKIKFHIFHHILN